MVEACPRCGLLGYRSVERRHNRYYIYFIHIDTSTKKIRKCYIGPADGYDYVERIHALNLDNLDNINYYDVALNALIKYILKAEKEIEERQHLREEHLRKIRHLMEILEKAIERLAKQ
ncbi:MAG: hypothetical protein QXV81_08100 [Ignisphaera sp.]